MEVQRSSNFSAVSQAAVQRVLSGLFTFVFPDNCRICEKPLEEVSRVPVCAKCLKDPKPFEAEYWCATCAAPFATRHPLDGEGRCALCRRGLNGFDAVYSFGFYDGTLRKLIQLFKYGNTPTLAGPLGGLLAAALPRERRFDVLTPVPMHWVRRFQRGYNQAGLLADEAGRRLGIAVSPILRRRKATAPQAGMTGAQRRANLNGAFAVTRPEAVRGRRVLLVDDVLTTGASAGACARVLKNAGAAHVAVLTVARADRRMPAAVVLEERRNSVSTAESGSVLDGQLGSPA